MTTLYKISIKVQRGILICMRIPYNFIHVQSYKNFIFIIQICEFLEWLINPMLIDGKLVKIKKKFHLSKLTGS